MNSLIRSVFPNRILKTEQIISIIFFVIAMGFGLLRLINLHADMPSDITWSGTFYTDEGIYARSAATLIATGNWHIEGDFNTAIGYPVYFILQVIFFFIFGINFEAVRILSAISALVTVILIWLIVKQNVGNRAAVISFFLISTNFLFFVFSRYGQADMPMIFFVVLGLACLLLGAKIKSTKHSFLSSFLMLCALLTKTSAIFAVPLFIFIIWRQQSTIKQQIIQIAFFLGFLGLGLIIYRFLWVEPYILDYERIKAPLQTRVISEPYSILQEFKKVLETGRVVGRRFYYLAVTCGFVLLIISKSLRQNILFQLSILWWIMGCAMQSVVSYHPPRYFSHLVIPLAIILGMGADYLLNTNRVRALGYVLLGLILVVCLNEQIKIVQYISSLEYSVHQMGENIREQIQSDNINSPLLIGHVAGNVTLATNGLLSVGAHFDDSHLTNKDFTLENRNPTHFVELGPASTNAEQFFKEAGYQLKLVKTYDVLNNYYRYHKGQPIHFYRVVELQSNS